MFKKILLLVFITLLFVSPTHAFGISPVKLLVSVDSKSSQTVTVSIKNSEDTDMLFNLGVLGVQQDNEGYPIFGKGVTEAEAWVFPESNNILIKAKQSEQVNFIIRIPERTEPGSYYLGLMAEPQLGGNNKSGINTRLISLLTIQVAGTVYEDVAIEKWEPKHVFFNDKKWDFNLNLKNSGLVEVLLKGFVVIRNWRGEDIFVTDVSLGNKLIAGSRRNLQVSVLGDNKIIWPGLYQGQIRIKYGLTGQESSSLGYVWYLPLWSIIILGVLIVVFLAIVFSFLRRKK